MKEQSVKSEDVLAGFNYFNQKNVVAKQICLVKYGNEYQIDLLKDKTLLFNTNQVTQNIKYEKGPEHLFQELLRKYGRTVKVVEDGSTLGKLKPLKDQNCQGLLFQLL